MAKNWVEPRMKNEALLELAKGIYRGEVFTTEDLRSDLANVRLHFMPLALLDGKNIEKLRTHPPAILCEWRKHALPISRNGKPIFMSMILVWHTDAKKIYKIVRQLAEAAQTVLKAAEND